MKSHSITIVTAAALLLGGASLATAQERGEPGGAAAQSERSGGPAAGANRGDGGQERGSRASGREEGSRPAERAKAAEEKGGDVQRGGREKSAQQDREPRGKPEREAREGRDRGEAKEAGEKRGREARDAREKAGEAKETRESKPARDRGDREVKETRDRDDRDRRAREAREGKDREGKDKASREARDETRRDGGAATGATSDRPVATGEGGRREARDRERLRDVQLTEEKRTRVRETFRRHSVKELRDVNFSISVGTRVPRRIALRPVPSAVIDIVPQYRGYRYFAVDGDIVIVEPDTYEIVYVIDDNGGGSRSAAVSADCERLALTDEERRLILRTIQADRYRSGGGVRVRVGERIPERLELYTFPDPVVREISKVRSCRFTIVDDNEIAIIDPDERKVVVLLD